MKKIIYILLFVIFAPGVLAQLPTGFQQGGMGNLGGFGGLGTGGGNTNFTAPENWIPDSVPLRITRFVESDLNVYQNFIEDTNTHHFELLPPKEKFNDAWMGNLAYAWYPSDFEERMMYKYEDFYFLNPFLDRIYLPEKIEFFRTNRPYTDLYYSSSIKDIEQPIVKALHTQNSDYYTNFGLMYESYGSKEFVRQSNSSVNSVKFWFSKEKHKYRYQINIFLNAIKLLDNGGIIDTGIYNASFEQYYLTKAQTKIGMYGMNLNPELIIFQKTDTFKLTLQNFGQVIRHYHSFYDQNPDNRPELYPHIYMDSTYSHDSVSYDQVEDEIRLKLISTWLNAQFAIGYEGQNFYYFRGYIYKPKSLWYNNLYIKGGFENLMLAPNLSLSSLGKYYLAGRRATNTLFRSKLKYERTKMVYSLEGEYRSDVPSYFMVRYHGNTNRWNNTQFVNQNSVHFKALAYNKRGTFRLSASYWILDHYINFNNAVPFQYGDTIHVYQLKFTKLTKLGFVHLDTWFNMQYSDKNNIVNLPLASVQASLWLDFYIFEHAMRLNPGVDAYFTTDFHQYYYHPAIVAFYVNPDQLTGYVPIVNAFINVHVKRMSLFFKFDFVNKTFLPIDYYSTVTHYHYPEFFYRFGARWWFKN